jgi:transcriptional regulator with XRE-family HTH domain
MMEAGITIPKMNTMPTTDSRAELDDLREMLENHIDATGETVTAIAKRAGLRRQFVSEFRSGNFEYSPSIEYLKKLAASIGKKMIWIDAP